MRAMTRISTKVTAIADWWDPILLPHRTGNCARAFNRPVDCCPTLNLGGG